jgi:hypothetical protein
MTAGFFSKLFGGGTESAKIDVQVYMHRNYVNQLIVDSVKVGHTVVISFFESTHHHLQQLAGEEFKDNFFLYSALHNSSALTRIQSLTATGYRILLSERFPIPKREVELMAHLQQWQIATYVSSFCALDDRIMHTFGSEKIMGMMRSMGMSERESIQHKMVTSALERAQKKIAEKVTYEQQAKSPEEWFMLNVPQVK